MEIIKKYWREAAMIVLAILLYTTWQSRSSIGEENTILLHSKDSSYLVARYYKNKNGELVNQVNTHTATADQFRQLSVHLGIDNHALKQQVGNLNNLVGYWKGQASMQGRGVVVLRDTIYKIGDSVVQYQKFDWTNKYLTLSGKYFPNDRHLAFEYNYTLGGFEIVPYYKNMGLFKKKQLVTDIKFGDPNMKITSFQGIVITPPKIKWYETRAFAFGCGVVTGALINIKR